MQKNPLKSILVIGAGAAAVWMATNPKENTSKIMDFTSGIKDRLFPSNEHEIVPVQKAGLPDPYDEDINEMVSEGSTYGIDYYNKTIQ